VKPEKTEKTSNLGGCGEFVGASEGFLSTTPFERRELEVANQRY
jgi:hypothetical protein